MGKCKDCGEESEHIINGLCFDCLADKWGYIVEKSPMVSPYRLLLLGNKDKTCVGCKSPLLEVQEVVFVINGIPIDSILREVRFCPLCGMAHSEDGTGLVAISIGDGKIHKNMRQIFIECTLISDK